MLDTVSLSSTPRSTLHGSTGAGYLRAIDGAPVCLTVTNLDGIVYARAVFQHSMNYRSAVVHGIARHVADVGEKWAALKAIVGQLAPGSPPGAAGPGFCQFTRSSVRPNHVLRCASGSPCRNTS